MEFYIAGIYSENGRILNGSRINPLVAKFCVVEMKNSQSVEKKRGEREELGGEKTEKREKEANF